MSIFQDRRILLIVSGGIAAIKVPDLIRRLRERGAAVRCILTKGGSQFVTPLSLAALTEDKVYQDLFSLTDESEMGHIRLSREADLVVVAPATADIMAKMANGHADDLATTALLATDKPVLIAPSMNVMMWTHPATQANLTKLLDREVMVIGPGAGDLACGETGDGRMAEVMDIIGAIKTYFDKLEDRGPLKGRTAIVTSGPTLEPIDPVRYIANRSSGKQGHAIAAALRDLSAEVTLITGPVTQPPPHGVEVIAVETAKEMLAACQAKLPADIAVCAAAVSDWAVDQPADQKVKKRSDKSPPKLALAENPDVLAALSKKGTLRPLLVVGFAAETEDIVANAMKKLSSKGCDWIVANDVSPATGTFGGDENTVHLVTADGADSWPTLPKLVVAQRLADRIADRFTGFDLAE